MRKLNLKDYQVAGKAKSAEGKIIDVSGPYKVKDSILNLMFTHDLQLSGAELVKQNALALKIEACKDEDIILEEDEYNRIKKAFDTFKGFGRNDVELVTRVNEAAVVEINKDKT